MPRQAPPRFLACHSKPETTSRRPASPHLPGTAAPLKAMPPLAEYRIAPPASPCSVVQSRSSLCRACPVQACRTMPDSTSPDTASPCQSCRACPVQTSALHAWDRLSCRAGPFPTFPGPAQQCQALAGHPSLSTPLIAAPSPPSLACHRSPRLAPPGIATAGRATPAKRCPGIVRAAMPHFFSERSGSIGPRARRAVASTGTSSRKRL